MIKLMAICAVLLGGCSKEDDMTPIEMLALFESVEAGDEGALKKALATGVSPNLYHSQRGYLIHEAVTSSNPQSIQMLIDAGADVNAKKGGRAGDWTGGTAPLVVAMLVGRCEAARILLRAGANPSEVLSKKQAAARAIGPELDEKTAREIYEYNKQRSIHAPINTWERKKACWLDVERMMYRVQS